MGELTLSLLGGFEARIGPGPPVPVPTKKAQALLAYLALPPGQSHPRDKLAALLWADTPPRTARNALRQTLFVLRRALGGIRGELFQLIGDAITLAPDAVQTDAAAFECALSEGTPAALERAVELYRGDLLSGLGVAEPGFEDWLMTERNRLRELALEALARRLAHQRTSGAAAPAVQTALRLLALDPLQEAVHRTLMRLYGQLGRRDAALRQYQECVKVLQHELGVEPEPETKALYQEILRQRPSQAAVPLAMAAKSADPPIVGRGAEVTRLHEALAAAWAGQGQVVAVLGEAGIGKSRLLADLAAEAEGRAGLVLLGRGYESERILPFGPWVGALRQGGVLMDARSLEGLDGVWLAELARLFPELLTANLPAVAEPGDPLRLFEALARLLRHLALRRPLVVMLEDVHWADDMSLRFLAFLGRRLYDAPVLVAVSVREEEMGDRPMLREGLDELAAEGRLTLLALPRLGRDDTMALVRLLGRTGSRTASGPTLAEHVWETSAGNPFIVVETMRAVAEGAIVGAPAGLPFPTRVRDMIARRLDRLSPRGRQLAGVAAVIGREFEFVLLQRTAGLAEHDTAEGVEELVRRRVLHATGERFDFTHDRIREVTYLALLPAHRRALHGAIVEAVEQLFFDRLGDHVEMVAYHSECGEVWDKAARYLREAGSRAAARLAYLEAHDRFERALAALDRLPDGRARTVLAIDIHLDMGPVLVALKSAASKEVEDCYARARELCERVNDRGRLFPALWGLWYVQNYRGNPERRREMGERLLEVARENEDRDQLLEAHHSLWRTLVERGEFARALTHLEQGYALYHPAKHRGHTFLYGNHDPGVCCRIIAARRLWLIGCPDQGLAATEDAVRLARHGAHWYTLALALYNAAVVHYWCGNEDATLARTAEVVALSDQPDILTSFTVGSKLLTCLLSGAGPSLTEVLEELARLQTNRGVLAHRAFFASLVAEAYGSAGRPDRGLEVLADALKTVEAGAERYYESALHRLRGELLLAVGAGTEGAEACFRRAVAAAQAIGARSLELRAVTSLARWLVDRGAPAEARAALAPVLGAFTEGHDTRDLRAARTLLAEIG
ncbi:MAG TPA: BTAD domain-containing putative transcriptional regulator [Methylomirabilota bacterium]|jgi:DNA-binding SARP family transcriptional activator/predicted ATPase|nr:BTAD domain-containing putative transcriptional regulator [Methylomirabilota bacterium]